MRAQPDDAELAAIVAAVDALSLDEGAVGVAGAAARPSPWALANRYPELDIDELRAVTKIVR